MKYLLFAGDIYYAGGGMNDLLKAADTYEELLIFLADNKEEYEKDEYDYSRYDSAEWWHIYNTETNEIECGSEVQAHGALNLKEEKVIENLTTHY